MKIVIKTDEQLLSELQIECEKIGRMLSKREIDSNINLSSYGVYNRRFKGLKNTANLINFMYTGDIKKLKTDEQLLSELQIECNKIGRMLSYIDINNNTNLSSAVTYVNRFNSLETVANLIGFKYIGNNEKSKKQLLSELSIECNKIGRMLLEKEIDNNKSISSCNTYRLHFNSLKNVANLIGFEYLGDKYTVSYWEVEVREYIESITNNITIIYNDRNILKPKELDIYIPKLKIALECNGIYWHSDNQKNKEYHIDKTIQCENKNITLIHIWDYEWKERKKEIKKYLKEIINNRSNKAIANKDGLVVVDRMKPNNYYNVELVKYTKPKLVCSERFNYWNCGSIIYKVIEETKDE